MMESHVFIKKKGKERVGNFEIVVCFFSKSAVVQKKLQLVNLLCLCVRLTETKESIVILFWCISVVGLVLFAGYIGFVYGFRLDCQVSTGKFWEPF
ncbi:hypothetical protein HanIR_Chr05g0221091 [Helianthus annuus]|nr:hypothetical protein HanIR_Chr05g0221091 [Helianthus annuus]